MKQMLLIATVLLLATGCQKTNCVQCAHLSPIAGQSTQYYTTDSIIQTEYCGLAADSAISSNGVTYNAFITEHAIQAYSCFYNQ